MPAESAQIGVVDKIFTRVGASDNISMGESTFMVEMNEAALILNNISERSLVLLDEIGRGDKHLRRNLHRMGNRRIFARTSVKSKNAVCYTLSRTE